MTAAKKPEDKGLPAISDMQARLDRALSRVDDATGGDFIKLDKSGVWIVGEDVVVDQEACKFKASIPNVLYGLTAWHNGEAVKEMLYSASEPPVSPDMLGPLPPEVKVEQCFAMPLRCVEGPFKGDKFVYKSSSPSAWNAFGIFLRQARAQGTETPLMMLDKSSYRHKKYGKIFTPIFTVIGETENP